MGYVPKSESDRLRIEKLLKNNKDRSYNDIAGKKFNYLTAVKKEVSIGKSTIWSFICDCGKIIKTRPGLIVRGKQRSCGCKNRVQYESKYALIKIGMVTPIKKTGTYRELKNKGTRQRRAIWLFRCDCGNEFENVLSFVKKQKLPSCGCVNRPTEDSSLHILYAQYGYGAKDRGLSFNLDFVQFKKLVKRPCYYCKSEPRLRKAKPITFPVMANGVDRTDNRKGYDLSNCVSCCAMCNRMKGTLGYATFMEHVNRISNRSCGDDANTRTTYVTEDNVGDTTKILLLCIYDLSDKFNLQKSEIMALFKNVLDQHITEIDQLTGEIS